ncbi:MAG: response regulator [Anaerolineales bacterium]|nr:response regulator [Anaerolineales bacterium]
MNKKQAPILVVDDEPEMCWILENIIRKAGLACITALNAREAIALTESNKFGMAFLDAKLPDIDGLELARKLRKTNAHLPIVIVSGYFYPDDPTIEGALQEGLIAAFVGKPFDHDEIVRIITHNTRR